MRLIDADAAIDRYYAEYEKQDICDGSEDRDWMKRCIEEAPTIRSADLVPKGRWENIVYNPVLRKMEATCSSCMCIGEIRVKGNCCGFVVPNSDFCPGCGADMREVVAENATTTGGDGDG